ncbi:MAG: RNA polymerase sigma factor [Fimbriimonadales bacterium]
MEAAAYSSARTDWVATEDEALILAAKNGEYNAFERLYEKHRNTVYRFVYQITRRTEEAEDITQEAFVRAFQNLYKFRKQAKFTTWILRIATNLCTDRARMSTRRMALEQQEAAGALEWMTVGTPVNPVEELEGDRRAKLVRKALAALPEHHRNVLIWRDFEQREYAEISEILGCSTGGAKLRVLRARRALRDRLSPLLEGGPNDEL